MTEPVVATDVAASSEDAVSSDRALREPTPRWRHLPERIDPRDYVETLPDDPVPTVPPPAGDPDTTWMLRYSAG